MTQFTINGRFLSAPKMGVARVAYELVLALDSHLARTGAIAADWELVHQEGVVPPNLEVIRRVVLSGPAGTLWEQTALAKHARGRLLINLANSAPVFHSNNLILFHDTQTRDSPQSYTRAFRTWYRAMQPLVARRAVGVMTVSQHSAARLSMHRLSGRNPIELIPNGLDHILRAIPPSNVPAIRGRFVLAMSSAQPHKNMPFLYDVLSDPRLQHVTLVLVGEAPVGTSLPRNTIQLGRIDDGMLRALYERADLFLYPSVTEGFGLPPGEAMLCGCPVVSSNAGALGQVYAGAAELLEPCNREEWVATVDRLLNDASERKELGARGRARASQMTWDRSATILLELVERLARQL